MPIIGRASVVAHNPQPHRQTVRTVPVVVHNEDAERRRGGFFLLTARLLGFRRLDHDRPPHDELASLARSLALCLDRAAVKVYQPLHQRQPDPKLTLRLLQRPLTLREHLEVARQLVGSDADVLHRHHHIAPFTFDVQFDVTTPVTLLGGVIQQVQEHLCDPTHVGINNERLLRERDGEFMAHLPDQRAACFDGNVQDGRQWHSLFAEFQLSPANAFADDVFRMILPFSPAPSVLRLSRPTKRSGK